MSAELTNYQIYRGKCRELSEKAIANDPTLTLVRGHYYCPVWGEQPHWWTITAEGKIFDPSVKQFPTQGVGAEYVPFDGVVECAQCGKRLPEEEASFDSNYAFCSSRCNMWFVGL